MSAIDLAFIHGNRFPTYVLYNLKFIAQFQLYEYTNLNKINIEHFEIIQFVIDLLYNSKFDSCVFYECVFYYVS